MTDSPRATAQFRAAARTRRPEEYHSRSTEGSTMNDHRVTLTTLYARFDDYAEGRAYGKGGAAAHAAVLDRLATNERLATAYGWTGCALERAGGMGRLEAWGVPPSDSRRQPIPDWPAEPRD